MLKTHASSQQYDLTDVSSINGNVNNRTSTNKRVKLPHEVIVRAPGLLNMYYMVNEIADDLGISEQDIFKYVELGAPYSVDQEGNLWIIGVNFAGWVYKQRNPKRENKLTNDQAFCQHCQADVSLVDPVITPMQGRMISIKGACPDCGCVIYRRGCQ